MKTPIYSMSAKFVASRFSLPLFMLSRNRIKYTKLKELRNYIGKRNRLYDNDMEKDSEKASLQNLQHVACSSEPNSSKNQQKSKAVLKFSSKVMRNSCQLPPNRYDTGKIPYESRRGIGGALWPKEHTHKSKLRWSLRQPHVRFYNFPKMEDTFFSPCNRVKGVFLTNARERRPTTRCMVSSVGGCYKNPSDPGPAAYYPILQKHNTAPSIKKTNPHLFHRLSTVPVMKNSIHSPHISFTSAPGRYETRYSNTCPCSSKLVYQPQIDLLIDKEKRKKFRRLSYETIKARQYASPDWRHVKGKGFPHLFMGAKPFPSSSLPEQDANRHKNIQLYPDSKYISMINNPERTPLSLRSGSVLNLMPRIKFNCIAKKVTRKHLRSNKKIAFGSSQERFPDGYRSPVLTQKQQEEIKKSLPADRQFLDRSIMNKPLSEINSKLDQTPQHMLPNYVPKLRKKVFKFQPLPEAKVLVTDNDINVKDFSKEGFYLRSLQAEHFFKDSS